MTKNKKKINYSTYDTNAMLLLNASSRSNSLCCKIQNNCGKDFKKYINTLEKKTIIKDKQIQNNISKCCDNLNCGC
tara:strand:+ start:53 stop:280 length:228 start_codon:yes stop_codon:yes gene_type:complete